MSTVEYSISKNIPVENDVDVIVIGGGPGGIGAAVMAARNGAKTMLVERYACLGGMATVGEVSPFMSNHLDGVPFDKPVYEEWVRRTFTYLPEKLSSILGEDDEVNTNNQRIVDKNCSMLAAEDLCLEAGVKLLYHHTLIDAIVTEGKIDCVILNSKSGFTAARAKVYIDCSGDADLAALSGCEFEQGGPSGHCQPMTTCFKLSNVDRSRMPERAEINRLYEAAKERGEMDCPRENVLHFNYFDDDVVHFNTTRVIHKSGTSGAELSQAEIEARKQVRQYLAFLRKDVAGFENARLYSIAHHIGIRETRRVKGINTITRKDYEALSKFPDSISRVNYPIDIHNPDGKGTEIVHIPTGEWYEIPYGCIVAKDIANLYIGGRPISVDHAVHSSMRVMPPACTIGQAAGLAAAVCAERGCAPAELDGVEIHEKLIAQGANL